MPRVAASLGLMTLCQLLAPAVIADWFCRRWSRGERWPLYANIINWTPLLLFIVLAPAVSLARVLMAFGASQDVASIAATMAISVYGVWFQWRVARGALDVSRWRAAQLLGATFLFSVVIVVIQGLFGPDMDAVSLPHK